LIIPILSAEQSLAISQYFATLLFTMDDTKPTETTLEDAFSTHSATEPKKSAEGIVLVPQPSNDPRDPLNWPLRKKIWTLAIVSLASFIGLAQALANQSGFFVQGAVYHKTPVEMSYSVCSFCKPFQSNTKQFVRSVQQLLVLRRVL
jgi:hypothetical protein